MKPELHRRFFSRNIDAISSKVLSVVSASAVLLLVLILAFLTSQAWPLLKNNEWLHFFSDEGWHPLSNQFGLLPMIWATLAAGIGALFIALPFGVSMAIFSLYIAPGFIAKAMNMMVNLLAGIPSVVFGLWGLTMLVPLINEWHAPGTSLLAAIIVLALMIFPTVAITSRAALSALPISYQHASACLSLSRVTFITQILLPAAKRGISNGILLALARAFGETMAVLMVAGNVVQTPHNLFDPIRVLTANIALEMAYATDQHRAALFASGLLLMLLVAIVLLLAVGIRDENSAPH